MLIISIIKVKKNYNKIKFGSINFGLGDRNLPIKIEYYRDIPCNGDIQKAYWLAFNYKIMSEKKVKEGIFGAYLLKWVKEKYIIINKNDNNLSRANKHNYTISFNNTPSLEDANERKLFNILKEAAGVNGILEPNELKKWCKTNYFKVALWFKDIDYCVKNKLEKEGYICTTVKEDKIFKDIFGKKLKSVSKKVNPELKKEVVQLLGFKKFLLDYSLIQEREYIEVELWEQYLMFAQLLGIAKKVQEQFSKVYPDFTNQLNFDINISNEIISDISHIYYYEADRRTISERITYSSSYSSGSGGDSFSGGGSSAGGSSGGGFR